MNRRHFLKNTAWSGLALTAFPGFYSFKKNQFPVHAITQGLHPHWFGYYDKWQIDISGRYALGCQLPFEGRSPTEKDLLRIGIIDLQANNKWTEIGTSYAWSWQQGCMLQWVPGKSGDIIWNDREGGKFICRVYNYKTKKSRKLPKAIYTLSQDGTFALGTEFNRVQNLRPGYGYAGIADPYENEKAPGEIGIYRLNLKTGEHTLLISLAEIAAIPHQGKSVADNWHWFNHLLVSPDSNRFLFLHRWRERITDRQVMASREFITRMITADADAKNKYVLDPSGNSSHFVWKDPKHVFVWTKPIGKTWGFYLLEDKTPNQEIIGAEVMVQNGHNTYVPNTNNEWVLNDTYPDKDRLQTLYLYHVPTNRQVILGKFYSPPVYVGEWRCDLHPRCNQQGTQVFFDSTHEGKGRQMYMIDIAKVIRS